MTHDLIKITILQLLFLVLRVCMLQTEQDLVPQIHANIYKSLVGAVIFPVLIHPGCSTSKPFPCSQPGKVIQDVLKHWTLFPCRRLRRSPSPQLQIGSTLVVVTLWGMNQHRCKVSVSPSFFVTLSHKINTSLKTKINVLW